MTDVLFKKILTVVFLAKKDIMVFVEKILSLENYEVENIHENNRKQ